MGWATHYIEKLKTGAVSFRPRGNSMKGRVESGQLVTAAPAGEIAVGDVVLCRVRGKEYLHLVSAIRDGRYQISNNRGHINGWVGRDAIFGKML